jgi:hypothetical protein
MLRAEQMIMIGSSGRNAGKTTVAKALISVFKPAFRIAVLKITCVTPDACCPHGSSGCGICSSLNGDYDLSEEFDRASRKDTAELLAAGADRVFWLRSFYGSLAAGYADFLSRISPGMLVLCESNSLRKSVIPGCFIMVINGKHGGWKPSARDVLASADITLHINDNDTPDISSCRERLRITEKDSRISVSVCA